MKRNNIPQYYLLRIVLVSYFMFAVLVLPFITNSGMYFIINYLNNEKVPSQQMAVVSSSGLFNFNIKVENSNSQHGVKRFSNPNRRTFNTVLLITFVIYFIFNLPFKIYFRRLRRGKPIGNRLKRFVRKHIYKTPSINAFLLFGLIFLLNLYLWVHSLIVPDQATHQYIQFFHEQLLIWTFASLMMWIFVYYWQKNRVQFFYIDHIFDKELLLSPSKHLKQRVANYIRIVYFVLLFAPVLIVAFYLITALVKVRDLGLDSWTEQVKEVLFYKLPMSGDKWQTDKVLNHIFYIPVFNTTMLIVGLISSTLSLLVYLVFFIRWTNRLILHPLRELLSKMRETTGGKFGKFAIVRNNDELGQLATEYNQMVKRLGEYFNRLEELNQNLEQKVIDRTRTIEEQKAEIEAQRDELLQKNREIESQQKEITDSIKSAARIQGAILLDEKDFTKYFVDSFVLYLPRDIVSGDFYWIKQLGNYIVFAAGDCTGHGVPGAFMSVLSVSFLNEIVNQNNANDPGQILNLMRQKIKAMLHQEQNRYTSEGLDIALCSIDCSSLILYAEGANNPVYVIRNRELIEIKPTHSPVGIYLRERTFQTKTMQLETNDALYVFSDGYYDQFDNDFKEKFSRKRFKKLLVEISDLPMQEQKNKLTDRFLQWKGDNWQIDDILVIGVRV